MKTTSQEYSDLERKSTRKPVELYKIWWGSTYWYYTNGDVTVTFDGHDYVPAVIKRGPAEYSSDLEVNTLSIQFSRPTEPLVEYIAQNPVEIVWIEVSRLFRDQSPLEKSVIFIGQIKNVSIKGASANAVCVGFEFFLSQPVPKLRYQPQCNWTLFDSKCTKVAADYDLTAVSVTVSSSGLEITHADFATQADDYFKHGWLEYENYKRMIVYHAGSLIKIQYKIADLITGEDVTVYAGCDGSISTCNDKFSNKDNFGGFPYIPLDNPCTWI